MDQPPLFVMVGLGAGADSAVTRPDGIALRSQEIKKALPRTVPCEADLSRERT